MFKKETQKDKLLKELAESASTHEEKLAAALPLVNITTGTSMTAAIAECE